MLDNFLKSCTVIAGIATTILATTVHARVFGPDIPSLSDIPPAHAQSVYNARSSGSSAHWPFTPLGSVAANPPVYGKTYGEWGAEWWKWALSYPFDGNPVQDETGELCDLGQSGHVWFLAGSFGLTGVERNCTIPAGKAIFYPLVNSFWFDEEGDEIITDEEVHWILASGFDNACQMTSTLDTFTTPNFGEVPAPISARLIPAVRAQSPKNKFNFPEENLLGIPPGVNDRIISGGYWVMLPPLSPGEHMLTLHGGRCVETEEGIFERVFETEVTYYLTVLPGN